MSSTTVTKASQQHGLRVSGYNTQDFVAGLWRECAYGGLKVKKVLFQVYLKVERLLRDVENSTKISKAETPRVRFPKINVPSFDWNILNWTSFSEQFEVPVDCQDSLRDVKKLAYLKDAEKDSPAKQFIEGLSRMPGS